MGFTARKLAPLACVSLFACTTGAGNGSSGLFGASVSGSASDPTTATATDDGDAETAAEASADGTEGATESQSGSDTSGATTADPAGGETTAAVCGDAIVQSGEECDGLEFGDAGCATLGFDDGVLGCDPDCNLLTQACFSCGDGDIALVEACDGNDFGGQSCASLGFAGGALGCAADCSEILTSGCQALPTCGDGIRNGGEQCDGNDFGGTTCTTLGYDMGNVACSASCTLVTSACMDDLSNCGMQGDFCLFDENDLQSTCCPAGVGGNVFGICNVFICS